MAKRKRAANECIGCDVASDMHPWVAVMSVEDLERLGAPTKDAPGAFAATPCCDECHKNPKNRKRTVKAHFFPRGQKKVATALAGSSSIG